MNKKLTSICLAAFCYLITNSIYCQTNSQNKAYLKIYDNYVGYNNNGLINGRSYLQQTLTIERSHLFFITPNFVNGSIIYKNQYFANPLKYDIVNDLIIIKNIDNVKSYALSITSVFVNDFKIHKHHFVRLPKHKDLELVYANGFFEKIYQGNNIRFFIKHKKKPIEVLDYGVPRYKFKKKELYLLYKNGHYYKISKQKHLKKAFPNLKKEINSFFRYNKDINTKSLVKLFTQLDKIVSNEIK